MWRYFLQRNLPEMREECVCAQGPVPSVANGNYWGGDPSHPNDALYSSGYRWWRYYYPNLASVFRIRVQGSDSGLGHLYPDLFHGTLYLQLQVDAPREASGGHRLRSSHYHAPHGHDGQLYRRNYECGYARPRPVSLPHAPPRLSYGAIPYEGPRDPQERE